MRRNIKTAVIGVGNMGQNHIRVYSGISQLMAVADLDPKLGRMIADKYNVRFYQDYKEMLEIEKPVAVSVVVPTVYHKDVAIGCLSRKVFTLVEKPIADTLENAKDILQAAINSNTSLMVGHIERFNPAIIKLKNLINRKKMGKIISLLAIRVGISPPLSTGSDVVLDLAIHDIDVFNYLLDEYPKDKKIIRNKIFSKNRSDASSMILQYKEATGMIQTNWITPIKMRKLYITGTEGFAELDYINQKLILYDKIINIKTEGDYLSLISLSDTPKKEIFISRKEPLKEELKFFLGNLGRKELFDMTKDAIAALSILT